MVHTNLFPTSPYMVTDGLCKLRQRGRVTIRGRRVDPALTPQQHFEGEGRATDAKPHPAKHILSSSILDLISLFSLPYGHVLVGGHSTCQFLPCCQNLILMMGTSAALPHTCTHPARVTGSQCARALSALADRMWKNCIAIGPNNKSYIDTIRPLLVPTPTMLAICREALSSKQQCRLHFSVSASKCCFVY